MNIYPLTLKLIRINGVCACCLEYLSKDSIFARGVQTRVVTVLHSEATVYVKAGHKVRLTGLRVLQALGDEGRAAL